MSNNFKREARYVVLKNADIMQCLTVNELIELRRIQAKAVAHRAKLGKPRLDCVVVESDWPEYEPTWKAIESRMTGAQPVPKAVAYLDIGAGGYMDIGTDLTDKELDAIPKGRHMLGVIGTYGVDGYVPTQPAPSAPEGVAEALQRLIEKNTVSGLGSSEDALLVARYRQHLLACAPSVPDGYKLVPIVSTHEMKEAGACAGAVYYAIAKDVWSAMLAAAPEAKP